MKTGKKQKAVTIRKMKLADFPDVIRISSQAFLEVARRPSYLSLTLNQFLKDPDWSFVAVVSGKRAGFMCATPRPGKDNAALNLIAIHPAFQGLGIGSLFLARLDAEAQKAGFASLVTGTPYAKGFYARNGFRVTRTAWKLVKDICQQVISMPTGQPAVVPIDTGSLETVVKQLPPAEGAALLQAFLAGYTGTHDIALAAVKSGKVAGTVCGKVHAVDGDTAVIEHIYAADDRTWEGMIRAFECECSKRGMRRVGSPMVDKARFRKKLERMGYRDSGYDYWNTLYFMRKPVTPANRTVSFRS